MPYFAGDESSQDLVNEMQENRAEAQDYSIKMARLKARCYSEEKGAESPAYNVDSRRSNRLATKRGLLTCCCCCRAILGGIQRGRTSLFSEVTNL